MKRYCVYVFLLTIFLYWNALFFVQINDKTYFASSIQDICYFIKVSPDTPEFTVLRQVKYNQFSSEVIDHTLQNCNASRYPIYNKYSLVKRPVVGDHIHLSMVLSVNNHVYNFHDRNMSQPIPYEVDNYPVTCPNPGSFSYEKRWYHTGVHTHCDGNIVHVHPWSAPKQLRVEGRSVILKMWFESVGIEVSPDKTGLKLPNTDTYIKDWNMEYYVNVQDDMPAFATKDVETISNLWLVDHHGAILLWSGGVKPDKDYKVLKYKSHPTNYPKRII
jgi:hypothetical protein